MKKLFLISFVILAIAVVFLRFYRVDEYIMFLSDQGRDAIVLKRLVTLEKLVFVGPTTSIGNVFTGPFYYYLVAPFLLLSRLDPVGPAWGVALINSIGLIAVSWYLAKRYGRLTGLLFFIFTGLSATQILQSRYSWNPNPVPVFSMLTLIIWEKAQESKRLRWFAMTGLLFGFCMQLHYITIVLLIPIGYSLFKKLVATIQRESVHYVSKNAWVSPQVRGMGLAIASFFLTFTPLLLFEVKNKFIIFQTFLKAFSTTEVQATQVPYGNRLVETIEGLMQHSFLVSTNPLLSITGLLLLIIFILFALRIFKQKRGYLLIVWSLLTILANILALSRLEVGRHVHYFHPGSWPLYLVISFSIATCFHTIKKTIFKTMFAIVCFVLVFVYVRNQVTSLYFLFDTPRIYTQTYHAKEVAQYIISQAQGKEFQVVGLPFFETEGHYRYFLEYLGNRPMPADTLGDPRELFVICHELDKPECDIAGNPQWQIADFQNRHQDWKIQSSKRIGDVRVFKLVY